jgi:hypothetical protein
MDYRAPAASAGGARRMDYKRPTLAPYDNRQYSHAQNYNSTIKRPRMNMSYAQYKRPYVPEVEDEIVSAVSEAYKEEDEEDKSAESEKEEDEESSEGSESEEDEEDEVEMVEVAITKEEEEEEYLTKENLASKMDKVDDDIVKYESLIELVEKKKEKQAALAQELAAKATSPISAKSTSAAKKSEQEIGQTDKRERPRFLSISVETDASKIGQRILRENNERAEKAHSTFNMISADLVPDFTKLSFYDENIQKHQKFKGLLIKRIAKHRKEQHEEIEEIEKEYYAAYENWEKRVKKWENHQMKKLLKNKNSAEYLMMNEQPVGNVQQSFRKKSAMMDNLNDLPPNQKNYDPMKMPVAYLHPETDFRYVKTLTKIPPMIYDEEERERVFKNTNSQFDDSNQAIRLRNTVNNPWLPEEKAIFIQKYLEYPKEFGKIASFLPNKNVNDCVLYYYLNKKTLKFKNLTRQAIQIRERRERRDRKKRLEDEKARKLLEMEQQRQREQMESFERQVYSPHQEFSEDEIDMAIDLFSKNGNDFTSVAEELGKTILACRRLYKYLSKKKRLVDPSFSMEVQEETVLLKATEVTAVLNNEDLIKPKPEAPSGDEVGVKDNELNVETGEFSDRDGSGDPGQKPKRGRPIKPGTEAKSKESGGNSSSKEENDVPKDKKEKRKTISYWTAKEKEEFERLFIQHGRNWKLLAEHLTSKSETQIRNYYQNHKPELTGAIDAKKNVIEVPHSNNLHVKKQKMEQMRREQLGPDGKPMKVDGTGTAQASQFIYPPIFPAGVYPAPFIYHGNYPYQFPHIYGMPPGSLPPQQNSAQPIGNAGSGTAPPLMVPLSMDKLPLPPMGDGKTKLPPIQYPVLLPMPQKLMNNEQDSNTSIKKDTSSNPLEALANYAVSASKTVDVQPDVETKTENVVAEEESNQKVQVHVEDSLGAAHISKIDSSEGNEDHLDIEDRKPNDDDANKQ